MAAAHLSPCRIKRKRHRWRRCASSKRYPGQRYDAASGLNQNGFRDYESGTGRYSQSDPIGLAAGWSTYSYANLSPHLWVDPDGLDGVRIDSQQMRRQGAQHAEAMSDAMTAFSVLSRHASEMRRKNIPHVDQFYHCLGACRATQATGDKRLVIDMMSSKENIDFWRNRVRNYRDRRVSDEEMLRDMAGDRAVNEYGAGCGPNEDCIKRCLRYLDLIPTSRRPEMSVYRPDWRNAP
ncbi:MAG: RHS repeat-associated core domain-containing protein [Pseudomonadota bacterium]|nr:RHS repeat-associated core domain-containing protein [Pseudomonadota bacterium]